jgi:hypothetical protein
MDSKATSEFHRDALRTILAFVTARGIRRVEELNAVKGKKLLEEPLWKLLELNGKYGGQYISEGVHHVEERIKRPVSASSGTWSPKLLERLLGPVPEHSGWKSWCDSAEYSCNLEHVIERRNIVAALLAQPESLDAILEGSVLGCVVLKAEHARLGRHDLDLRDPWKRYRFATPPIRVWSRDRNQWIDLDPLQNGFGE